MASNKTIKKIKYLLRFLPDKRYIQIYYFSRFKRFCNFKNPKSFNEKLQWLKIHDINPRYTQMVDKYDAKKYVADIIGEEHIIPTLGVWDSFDEINFDELPDQFVLKCTHDSEGIVIVKDKAAMDIAEAKKVIETALKYNFFYIGREYPYKPIKPRIIAEKYMVDESGYELKDYKFFTMDGVAKAMFIASDREVPGEKTKCDYFDMDFNRLPMACGNPVSTKEIKRPETFDEMKALAEKLGQGLIQARIDFYDINGKVYFGEITLYHWSGFAKFTPDEWDYKFGEWINLPK